MPTYQYKCSSCEYIFEQFSSISSYNKELECPVCQSISHLTITGGTGLIFKGSGFYITDYQKKINKSNGNK
jgi:putative FmdB family regulatory protein